jgi:5'(3')-deoxyribonucleotidase
MDRKKTIAIDFDGVIHAYSRGWEDGVIYDEPMAGARDAIRQLAEKYEVVVFTARDCIDEDGDVIWDWLEKHGFKEYVSEVTSRKPAAWAYIDDRAIRFENWHQAMGDVQALDPADTWRHLA